MIDYCGIAGCTSEACFTETVIVEDRQYTVDTCPAHGAPLSEPEIERGWMVDQLVADNVTFSTHWVPFGNPEGRRRDG